MTALEVMAMNRAAHKRNSRRSVICAWVFGLLRDGLLILAFVWCYTSREALARMIDLTLRSILN